MQIRIASVGDAPAISRVHVDSWRTTYQGIIPGETLNNLSYEQREAVWQDMLAKNASEERVFVAEVAGQIVGFASCGPERTEHPKYTGELYAIYLLEESQNRGIGRALTSAVAGFLEEQGHQGMLVWVLEDNPSRAFYERLGGQEVLRKPISVRGTELIEVAYGWTDIGVLED